MPEALKCFEEQLAMGWQTGKDFERSLSLRSAAQRTFTPERSMGQKIVKESDCPMLIEILSDRVHYWVAKIDLAAIDGQMRRSRIPPSRSTSRVRPGSISIPHGRRYGRPPPILHCSPTGSVERVICAILENISTQPVPALPTWLSPVQVRVVPVAERHGAFAEEICTAINAAQIRCDVDDREESVGKKVREAGMDWVPFVIVVGDEEVASRKLTVTIRRKSQPNKPFKEQLTLTPW